jgi:hypothetical protein
VTNANHEPLDLGAALSDLPTLEQAADEFEAKAANLMAKAQAVRQIIAGVKALNGSAESVLRRFDAHKTTFAIAPPDEQGPRGPRAVMQIVRQEPGRRWKVVELKREMLRRGWAPSPKAVEASIKRLRERGELVDAGYGYYSLPPSADEIVPSSQEEAA